MACPSFKLTALLFMFVCFSVYPVTSTGTPSTSENSASETTTADYTKEFKSEENLLFFSDETVPSTSHSSTINSHIDINNEKTTVSPVFETSVSTTSSSPKSLLDVQVHYLNVSRVGEKWLVLEVGLSGNDVNATTYLLTIKTSNKTPVECHIESSSLELVESKEAYTFNVSNSCSNVELLPCTAYNMSFLPLNSTNEQAKNLTCATWGQIDNSWNLTAEWVESESDKSQVRLSWNNLNCTKHLSGWRVQFNNNSNRFEECELKYDNNTLSFSNCSGNTTSYLKQENAPINVSISKKYSCSAFNVTISTLFKNKGDNEKTDFNNTFTLKPKDLIPPSGGKLSFTYQNAIGPTFRWDPPEPTPKCVYQYGYTLHGINYDGTQPNYVFPSNTIFLTSRLEFCEEYDFRVWAVSNQPSRKVRSSAVYSVRVGPVTMQDVSDIQVNATAVNESCISVNRTIPEGFLGRSCLTDYEIEIVSMGRDYKIVRVHRSDSSTKICNLKPGTAYNVTVKNLKTSLPISVALVVTTTSPEAQSIVGYIIALVVLAIVALGILGIYLYKLRKNKAFVSERRSSLFNKLGRRHSHPVRVRDLPKATSDLLASAGHLLEMEFEDMNIIAEAQKGDACRSALSSENKIKNRYINILPYEHSRVLLTEKQGDPESTYINASYIMGYNGPKEYIASQGPKDNTLEDFWRMIWEQNVRIIVMVTALAERGKPKCDRYWPDVNQQVTFDELSIGTKCEESEVTYIKRTLDVRCGDTVRNVYQFYFQEWPDFGCPSSPEVLIRFIEVIRSSFALLRTENSTDTPILVHCSAGVGRTGTFIAVDWLMQQASAGEDIDIFSTILQIRSCRMKMVQSEEQYEYVYKCLSHYVSTRLLPLQAAQREDNEQDYLLRVSNSIPLIQFANETRYSMMP